MGELMEGLIAALGIVAGLMVTLTSLWWETPPLTRGQNGTDQMAHNIYPEEDRLAA